MEKRIERKNTGHGKKKKGRKAEAKHEAFFGLVGGKKDDREKVHRFLFLPFLSFLPFFTFFYLFYLFFLFPKVPLVGIVFGRDLFGGRLCVFFVLPLLLPQDIDRPLYSLSRWMANTAFASLLFFSLPM